MARIGFYQARDRRRSPYYSATGEKLCYLEGEWLTDLEGRKLARILRYHVELAEAKDVEGSVWITADEIHEV